jgi:hypothetical protein
METYLRTTEGYVAIQVHNDRGSSTWSRPEADPWQDISILEMNGCHTKILSVRSSST